KLYLNITSQYENGTITFENIILNLETGVVGDDFIIPANLTLGDEFFDINQGNITITDIEEKTIAGSQRSIIKGNTNETSYCWDQKSGMLVSAITITPNYTMKTSLNATNIWKTQESVAQNSSFTLSWFDFNLDLTTIFALTVGVIAIIIIIMSSVILRRHKLKTKET
ncbi:MAG: hypothetical protein GX638_12445, partial [Crenarchaeota archaeon]|nr:hypothetical protein [Thermoproteota archaeon]